jgi:hypothetical protein
VWQILREALSAPDQTVDFREYDLNQDGKIDSHTFL